MRPAAPTSELHLHEFLLLPAVFLSPLAVAAVHPPVVIGFAASVVAAFGVFLATGGAVPSWKPARALAAVLFLGCAVTLVQLLPLPQPVIGILSPRAVEIGDQLRANVGIVAPATPSLDRAGTGIELLKACACAMVFIMAAASGEKLKFRLLATVALAGFAVILIGVFQKLAGVKDILGFYRTAAFDSTFFVSTFVNPNHLAGYLGLAACVSLGLGVEAADRPRRVLFVFVAAVTGAGVFLSLSRGGIVAFAAAQLFLLFLLVRRRVERLGRATWWHAGLVVALAVASWLAYAEISRELSTISTVEKIESDKKLQSFAGAARMAAAFWPLGAGRGAYEGAINMFRKPGHVSWTYAENEYIQAAADMGIPFAAVFFAALVLLFAAVFAARRGPADAGVLSGVYMLALHNFVDFNLEILSVEIAFFAVLGAAAAGGGPPVVPAAKARPSAAAFLLLCLGVAALPVAALSGGKSLKSDTERLRGLLAAGGYSKNAREIREILARHRADYFLPLLSGAALMREKGSDPRLAHGMLRHAMFLNPVAHEPHLLAARLFERAGNVGQAMAEYRQAVRLHRPVLESVLHDLHGTDSSLDFMSRAVPEEPDPMLGLAEFLVSRDRNRDAISVLRDLLTLHPGHEGGTAALARTLARTGAVGEAAELAQTVVDRNPSKADGYRLLAAVESAAGRSERARELYRKALTLDRFDVESLVRLSHIYSSERNFAEARRTVRTIFLAPDAGGGARAQAHMLLASVAEAEGRRVEALAEYRRARDLMPGASGPIWGIARMHEALSETAKAIEAYRDILRLAPGDKGAAARMAALEEARRREVEKAKEIEYLR